MRGLSKCFGAVVVGRSLDLDVEEGCAIGILGPNGAGKTTLFSMISGTSKADSGQIWFLGQEISNFACSRRCRMGIGRAFQVPRPFGQMTVFENLVVAGAFGTGQTERSVYDYAATVLQDCGLDSKANQKAATLELLDRKRLELARALATQPRLLLLDEVAGGLSDPECESLLALIRKIRATGVSIIWIEHIVHALVSLVDRIVVLADGRFIADDKPQAVIEHPQVIELYMGIEAAGGFRKSDDAISSRDALR